MIRKALVSDAKAVRDLLNQLGYPANYRDLEKQLETLLDHPDHNVLVYETGGNVAGFISVYFVPRLAVDDAVAVINYLAVDEKMLGQGIGKTLEQAAEKLAWETQCDRIQLHCRVERIKAHGFYKSRGYREYPVFYSKRLIYAE